MALFGNSRPCSAPQSAPSPYSTRVLPSGSPAMCGQTPGKTVRAKAGTGIGPGDVFLLPDLESEKENNPRIRYHHFHPRTLNWAKLTIG